MKLNYLFTLLITLGLLPNLRADLQTQVNDLIPKLAAEKIEDRYQPQMELQYMAANASRPGAEAERKELAALLAAKAALPDTPHPARVWMVRQLEHMGGAESVTALAVLLNGDNQELKESSRRALEKNSSSQAAIALRRALEHGKGNPTWTAGLIHALGQRRDRDSVDLISPHLDSPALSACAATALANIASPAAVAALTRAAAAEHPTVNSALLAAADQLLEDGEAKRARKLYQRFESENFSPAVRASALTGQVRANPRRASKLITKALQEEEPRLQQAAIAAASEQANPKLSTTLAKLLPKLSPSAKIQVLQLLDASHEPVVIETSSDADEHVRVAALETLGRIGGGKSVPPLITASTTASTPEKTAAQTALTTVSGKGALEALSQAADHGDPAARGAAINALAARNNPAILPRLMVYASDPDVSKAALAALRKMGTANEFPALAELLVKTGSNDALTALKAIAGRLEGRSEASATLLKLTRNADAARTVALLEVLSLLGGPDALALTTRLVSSENPELKDGAIRALSNWREYAATDTLLAIAENPETSETHSILAIRGIVQLIKAGADQPAKPRVDLALAAMKTARREEEKKLVLSALGSIPHVDAAAAIKPLLQTESLKAEAGRAGADLAVLLLDVDKPTAKDLAEAVKAANISRNINRKAEGVLRD